MTTRKDLITIKYIELLNKIKQHTPIEIFPSLEDIEIYEMVYYFNMYFNFDYKNHYIVVKDIIQQKKLNISDEILNIIYPDIDLFLNEFHNLIKKQE